MTLSGALKILGRVETGETGDSNPGAGFPTVDKIVAVRNLRKPQNAPIRYTCARHDNSSSTDCFVAWLKRVHVLCPPRICGGSMFVVERLTSLQIRLRSPPATHLACNAQADSLPISNPSSNGCYHCAHAIAIFQRPHSLTIHSCVFRSELYALPITTYTQHSHPPLRPGRRDPH